MQNEGSVTDPTSATDTAGRLEDGVEAGCGSCGCGAGGCGTGQGRVPELDARLIDAQIRQAAIFGVLIGLPPGAAADVITDSSPELVTTLIAGQFAGQYTVSGAQLAEQEWRTRFTRVN